MRQDSTTLTIGYLVHDVNDANVHRRVAMMRAGGAVVRIGGFRRRSPPAAIDGVVPVDLGLTRDMRMVQRAGAVIGNLVRRGCARSVVAGADAIVARNLEMLIVAAALRRPGQRLIYECIDIHRLLLGGGPASRLVQRIERRLLKQVDLIVTSSPAFVDRHFRQVGFTGLALVLENKVWRIPPLATPRPRRERPWRIAWMGILRCRRSLLLLGDIAAAGGGAIEVTVAGRVAHASIPDFDRLMTRSPHLRFVGSYADPDLPRLYGAADFAWVMDYYEEGANSAWLLPNRLYESMAFGAVPIAQAGTQIAAWLARAGVGLTFTDVGGEAAQRLCDIDADAYAVLADAVAALPVARTFVEAHECATLVAAIGGER